MSFYSSTNPEFDVVVYTGFSIFGMNNHNKGIMLLDDKWSSLKVLQLFEKFAEE